ncbi:hypothetical protein G6724_08435 [Polynucleobacter paneuropaeus]|nr:hypothetical protein [Polynucleobacter paneuropaeus]
MKLFYRFFQLGPIGFLQCLTQKYLLRRIVKKYQLDPWHATAPYQCRPYKAQVVKMVNATSPNSVLEIGCGLGDIVSRIQAKNKFGVDLDPMVIKVAKELHGQRAIFTEISLGSSEIKKLIESKSIDFLLMCNWPHTLEWADLNAQVEKLLFNDSLKYILVDGIPESIRKDCFHHGMSEFSRWGRIVQNKLSPEGDRILYLIDVKPSLSV